MTKIFVIGSFTKYKEIVTAASTLNAIEGYTARYAKPMVEDRQTMEEVIAEVFKNIEWCDLLFVVSKEGGRLGDCTLYEIAYARKLKKPVFYI